MNNLGVDAPLLCGYGAGGIMTRAESSAAIP